MKLPVVFVAVGNMECETLTPTVATEAAPALLRTADAPAGTNAEDLVRTVLTALDDAKAENVVPIELGGKTTIADTMLIATGRSNTHVGAIADRVLNACKASGVSAPRVEGLPHCDWVLVDAGDVIIHVFRPEVRAFYNLEKMWGGDRPVESAGERRPV